MSYFDNHFRIVIYGASGSGKTTFVKNLWNQFIGDKFNNLYVFTPEHNREYYQREFSPTKIYTDKEIIPFIIENIKNKLSKKKKKGRTLFIFDDVVDPSVTRTNDINELIFSGRHLGISTIMISQSTSEIISTGVEGNSSQVFFRTNSPSQMKKLKGRIKMKVEMDNINNGIRMSDRRLMAVVMQTIKNEILDTPFGFIFITEKGNIIFNRLPQQGD